MTKDPYRYFRIEARELLEGLTRSVLELERSPAAGEAGAHALRLAHTLKGAARVVKQAHIAQLAHTIEGTISSQRDAGVALSKEDASALLAQLDEIAARLSTIEPAAPSGARVKPEDTLETLRVDVDDLDALLRGTTDSSVQLRALRSALTAADSLRAMSVRLLDELPPDSKQRASSNPAKGVRALAEEIRGGLARFRRTLATDLDRLDVELGEVRELAHRLRLISASTIFPALERNVRDAAQALGKQVEFVTSGGDVRIDASVLSSLADALAHVVRNAVVHGIEGVAERVAAGKPAIGRVQLTVARSGTRIVFTCGDDGRGIDLEAVRAAAVARGRVAAQDAAALQGDALIGLLRTGGLTTMSSVTELSGRGIGLDVLRATAERLKGQSKLSTTRGRGTSFELHVPVSMSSLEGLIVEAAGDVAAIPFNAVVRTLRVAERDVARSAGADSIVDRGQVIPFVPLARAMGRPEPKAQAHTSWSAVVVEAGSRRAAIGVDRLVGRANIVTWPLPDFLRADPAVAGAALDDDGNPQLVLEPSGLINAAETRPTAQSDANLARRAPVLVVDDSLTTRMLEQSILESAGYEVELAVSAEDALAKAQARRYSLFLVDVEMPGMSGFDFVARTRADTSLRSIPAILVTSRGSADDRRRGVEVGARAYVVKGEFDQRVLLQTIRGLIG